MTPVVRITKQVIVAIVFFLIIGGLVYGGRFVFKPQAPTPTPNPTISLDPISIVSTQLFNINGNDYDFLVKVTNPNAEWGSGDAEYELNFFNNSGEQVSQKRNSFYVLPGQTKYILESPLKFDQPIGRVEMKIISVDWRKLDPISTNDITLVPRNYSYGEIGQSNNFGKVGGSILNNSNIDLGQVSVIVLLFSNNDSIIATNKTEILTFLAKTSRGFEVTWYSPFVGKVGRVEVAAYTNVFDNSNFLRQYGRPEEFQQYY